ncbi:hypothetical protein PMAYCL1PPCAC_14184, partial [Pristionchus mayeri]
QHIRCSSEPLRYAQFLSLLATRRRDSGAKWTQLHEYFSSCCASDSSHLKDIAIVMIKQAPALFTHSPAYVLLHMEYLFESRFMCEDAAIR